MPPLLLDLLYLPFALLYLPFLLYQMIALGKNRRGWAERFGFISPARGDGPAVWIHAVSLGEVNAARGLVGEISRRLPGCRVLLSSTTDTGYAAACRIHDPALVFRYPLDFSPVVRRVLRRLRPEAIILMELEAWPNLITLARRRGIPVGIANGRVTEDKSMRRFQRPIVRGLARRMFSQLAFVAAQDETYAGRFLRLGVPPDRLHLTGSMKFDTAVIADHLPGDADLARALGIDRTRPLIVAGSTGPGEEALLLDAFERLRTSRSGLQLALVPRRPERFDEVAALVESRGLACLRRSRCPDGAAPPPEAAPRVILGDTMGELRKFYVLADVVFVGRTLVPLGGSDMIEVAALARPMCFGPSVENFRETADRLLAAGAARQVDSPGRLLPVLQQLLADGPAAREMGLRAREVIRRGMGATARTADILLEVMNRAPPAGSAPRRPALSGSPA